MAKYDVDKYQKQYDMVIEMKIKPNKTFSTGDAADWILNKESVYDAVRVIDKEYPHTDLYIIKSETGNEIICQPEKFKKFFTRVQTEPGKYLKVRANTDLNYEYSKFNMYKIYDARIYMGDGIHSRYFVISELDYESEFSEKEFYKCFTKIITEREKITPNYIYDYEEGKYIKDNFKIESTNVENWYILGYYTFEPKGDSYSSYSRLEFKVPEYDGDKWKFKRVNCRIDWNGHPQGDSRDTKPPKEIEDYIKDLYQKQKIDIYRKNGISAGDRLEDSVTSKLLNVVEEGSPCGRMGEQILNTFKKCKTKNEYKIANQMLKIICGKPIEKLLNDLGEEDALKEIEMD